jgi:hypothetical protein
MTIWDDDESEIFYVAWTRTTPIGNIVSNVTLTQRTRTFSHQNQNPPKYGIYPLEPTADQSPRAVAPTSTGTPKGCYSTGVGSSE